MPLSPTLQKCLKKTLSKIGFTVYLGLDFASRPVKTGGIPRSKLHLFSLISFYVFVRIFVREIDRVFVRIFDFVFFRIFFRVLVYFGLKKGFSLILNSGLFPSKWQGTRIFKTKKTKVANQQILSRNQQIILYNWYLIWEWPSEFLTSQPVSQLVGLFLIRSHHSNFLQHLDGDAVFGKVLLIEMELLFTLNWIWHWSLRI